MGEPWRTLDDGVLVRRHRDLDLNVGLVVGASLALVIDTRSSAVQGRELLAAVRDVTDRPLVVVNTHAHYDHFLGNCAFADSGVTEFWAHQRAAASMIRDEARQRQLAGLHLGTAAIGSTPTVAPSHVVAAGPVVLDLGGRRVALEHLGRAHTAGDLIVTCGATTFAGDVVEEGAPPSFEDSYPREWPDTLRRLGRRAATQIVPGHGGVLTPDELAEQADLIEAAATAAADARWREQWIRAGRPPAAFGAYSLAPSTLAELLTRIGDGA